MKTSLKYTITALAALLTVSLVVCGGLSIPAQAASSYYVDCSAGSNGDGSSGSPWNNLGSVNATTFSAGDSLLLKRGTTCHGQLWPKGSGASGSPITLRAYGSGAQPIVDGDNDDAYQGVLYLSDQEYWEIEDIEITNGAHEGVFITGTGAAGFLNYFRLTDLYIHDICISNTCGGKGILVGKWQLQNVNDVVIDNCTVHDAFKGVVTNGDDGGVRSTDVTVRNSLVYNIHNDGIFLASGSGLLIEYNVAHATGIQTIEEEHPPNAIWTWDTDNTVVQFNEAYENVSIGAADGGAFDIDYFTDDTIVQYNYGHDNENMCVAVYGGDRSHTTTNNVIRYNVCANNCRQSDLFVDRAGEIRFAVWTGGKVADTYIYNNTVYWSPANAAYYAVMIANTSRGKSIDNTNIYNNIFYATTSKLVGVMDFMAETTLDYNLYWYTGAGDPEWLWGNNTYTSLSAWQAGSGQDANSIYADPKLNGVGYHGIGMPTTEYTLQSDSPAINAGADLVTLGLQTSMGSQDFYGNAIPNGAYDIGAHEYGGTPPDPTDTPIPPPTNTPGGPTETPVPPTDTPSPTDTPAPTSTPGSGINLALNQPVTASSMKDGFPPENAVDGDILSQWKPVKTKPNKPRPNDEWIRVDLGATYTVSQVTLTWDPAPRYATDYSIDVSLNDSDWTTVYSTSSGSGGTAVINFDATDARYVRFYATAWTIEWEGDYLCEFEVYE